MYATTAMLKLNPDLQRDLECMPHNVLLILTAFAGYPWLLRWQGAAARAVWRALPERLRHVYSELIAEVWRPRDDGTVGLELSDGDRNTDLAYRICRFFGLFLVLPVSAWSTERGAR